MLDTLGNVGSFIGGIGVALTVAYLAVQVRLSGKAAKAAAAQAVMQSLSEYLRSVAESPQLAAVIGKSYANHEALNDSEATQIMFWTFAYFRLIELAHHHYRLGGIPDSFWKGQARHLSALMTTPTVLRFWAMRQGFFSDEFRELIDGFDPAGSATAGEEFMKMYQKESDA